jgi:hypothetical protein
MATLTGSPTTEPNRLNRMGRVVAHALTIACCTAVCLVVAPRSLSAQGLVGGYAVDKGTGTPLACIDVAMVRDDSVVVAKTRTLPGGAFAFPSPARGRYRLRFGGLGLFPVFTAADSLFPNTDQDRVYRLDQSLAMAPSDFEGYKDTDPDAPPRPRNAKATPRYPERLRLANLEGKAVVRYLVDSLGIVDPKSIERLMGTDLELFASIRAFLVKTPFVPGRRDSVPVCDLLVQVFDFRLRH